MAEYTRQRISGNRTRSGGPYEAVVVNHLDSRYMGTLEVELLKNSKSGNNPERTGQLHTVRYLSPFYGVTPLGAATKNDSYEWTQKSYGFWMIPPDIGTRVLVIFVEENTAYGYWIGCIQDSFMNFMIPDSRASTTFTTANTPGGLQGLKLPVGEYNKKLETGETKDPTKFLKPYNRDFTQVLEIQGLLTDEARGISTSSARRDIPSMVFGFSSPGPVDRRPGAPKFPLGNETTKAQQFTSRLGGSSLVFDDGDDKFNRLLHPSEGPPVYTNVEAGNTSGDPTLPKDEHVRIRTRTGHQILLHNTEDLIYISNSRGTAWIEISSDGKIDIHAQDSISVMSNNDINFTAERDFNVEAGRNINLRADGRWGNFEHFFEGKENGRIQLESKFDTKLFVEQDYKIIVERDKIDHIKRDHTINIEADKKELVKGNYKVKSYNDINFTAERDFNVEAGRNINLRADGRWGEFEHFFEGKENGRIQLESKFDTKLFVEQDYKIIVERDKIDHIKRDHTINIEADKKELVKGNYKIQSQGELTLNTGSIVSNKPLALGIVPPILPYEEEIFLPLPKEAYTGSILSIVPPILPYEEEIFLPLPKVELPYVIPGLKEPVLYPSILCRAPQHEPWTHHENLNPLSFKKFETDREEPGLLVPGENAITPDTFRKNSGIQAAEVLLSPVTGASINLSNAGSVVQPSNDPLDPTTDAVTNTEQVSPSTDSLTDREIPATINGFTREQTAAYLSILGERESSNRYGAVNTIGFAGKYQFGWAALVDSGMLRSDVSPRSNDAMNNPDNWTGKYGVNSLDDWLSNKNNSQELAIIDYTNRNLNSLQRNGGISPSDGPEQIGGMLMGAHLLGATGMRNWRNGQGGADAYGTTGSEYYSLGSSAIRNS